MTDRVGAIWVPRNAAEIRDQFLRDVRLGAIDAGLDEPPVQPGTDWYLTGDAIAAIALTGLANLSISDSDSDILTATDDALEDQRIARGLPEVAATGSTGKVVIEATGSTTILNGQGILLPNGLRAEVVGNYVGVGDGDEIDVQATSTGEETNFPGGTEVTFLAPVPTNLVETAEVSEGEPLTGGAATETDERKRARILNAIQNRPAGGNWAHIREFAFNSLATVSDAFVYPALGGPASLKVVPVRLFDRENRSFTRGFTATALDTIRKGIQAQMPTPMEIVVQNVHDQPVSVALELTLPNSVLSGGNGQGWIDAAPWPPLVGGDSGKVTVSAASGTSVTVTAVTTTDPVDNQTTIAWWSTADLRFYLAGVIAHSGGTGAWVLTTNIPLTDSTGAGPQVGDYISPAARNIQEYGDAWLSLFESFGPAENSATSGIIPRAKRRPFVSDGPPSDLGSKTYAQFVEQFDEITDFAESYAGAHSPPLPGTASDAPNIWVPEDFGIYVQ
jgi:hypothetical protein